MKKHVLLAFIGAFIALGWVGCEPKPGPGPDPEPEPDVPTILTEVLIDSAYTCCGIDSFAIKSPWVQQEINRFMTDTAIGFSDFLTIDYAVDGNGDYYFIEQYSYHINRLYDCSGNVLKEVEDVTNEIQNDLDFDVVDEGQIVMIVCGREGFSNL